MAIPSSKLLLQGNGAATNAGATKAIIAAQGAGTNIRLIKANISIYVAATGGSGLWSLQDGSTVIHQGDANSIQSQISQVDFGDEGYPLSANNALNLVVSGAVTNQASVYCSAIAVLDK